jgi:hypothetical protein
LWVLRHSSTATAMTISAGISQTTASTLTEYAQVGS